VSGHVSNRHLPRLLLALGIAACCSGCGKPYYVEGQDELGEVPDSLRVRIEEREEEERVRREGTVEGEGVRVLDLGEEGGAPSLPLEYEPESAYLLRRGDKVEVEVLFYPELTQVTSVRPDGMITAQGVGDVPALGRRPEEVAADIEAYYSKLLRDPMTTVNVLDFGERRAYLFGQVNRPGFVSLEQRMTLTQALASVGSVTEDAKVATVVLLRRKSANTAQAYRLDLRDVLKGKSLAADVVLQPDDVVYVPRTFVANMQQFVNQVFDGLVPIPSFFVKTYDAIHVDERAALRQNTSSGTTVITNE
jgi:polysaccharide export outer membrane protein